uniref:Uncharacterized protein n=1 Tax=Arundo donax TaxID=35708 RepID=A0A0A8Z3Q7_ARUDO
MHCNCNHIFVYIKYLQNM